MAVSYVNDLEIKDISKEIISLADEFNDEINSLFKRLSEVPTVTREWTGTKAQFYFNRIVPSKFQYNTFARNLKDIGNKLTSDLSEITSTLVKNVTEEEEKGY